MSYDHLRICPKMVVGHDLVLRHFREHGPWYTHINNELKNTKNIPQKFQSLQQQKIDKDHQ